ncbi:MAG TPA: outer membrane lipoprotein-sorting protein, partial [Steroidobacteraceae bacterium]|nr:outer membrane lipoprotein-sorting protein [Steroidobacteraceae bacterium]
MLPGVLLSLALPVVLAANAPATPTELTAAQIVDRDIEAKGGRQAWRAVHTLRFSGKMDAGGKQHTQLPFVFEMKRPRKTRVEIEFAKDNAIQVYDGTKGWKLRPYLGRRDLEPFTAEELKAASMESDLDGPLMDYAAKGTRVDLDGMDKVEGQDAYKLKLTAKDGHVRHLWVDAKTFLELKIEGVPRRIDGGMHPVEIYYRDYRNVNGLMIPHVFETTVVGVRNSQHKMTIESAQVNPQLDDALFTAPKTAAKLVAKSK